MAQKKTWEPLLWTLFSAGGVVAAIALPIHLLLFGLAVPLGWVDPAHGHLLAVLRHPITRIYLFVLCTLALVHGAHRFRYTLYDGLQLKHLTTLVAVLCYGTALAGTVMAAYLLWTLP